MPDFGYFMTQPAFYRHEALGRFVFIEDVKKTLTLTEMVAFDNFFQDLEQSERMMVNNRIAIPVTAYLSFVEKS